MADFAIGDFIFDNFHEYREGQEDLKKIEAINNELDVQDPDVAFRLYNLIRDGKITFHTAIGDDFAAHIADIVADKSQHLIDDEEAVLEAKRNVRFQRIAGAVTAAAALALFVYFGARQYIEWNTARKISELRDTVAESNSSELEAAGELGEGSDSSSSIMLNDEATDSSANQTEDGVNPFERVIKYKRKDLNMLPEYQEAYAMNNDMIGWMSIPDTEIDYPVMWRKDDNDYYLNHAFDNTESAAGSLFMDYRSDAINPTTNTIIYGHNMKSGAMFGQVKNYLNQDYYNTHKNVRFDTLYEKRMYEVVAVCLSEVAYQDENSYRYYNFIQASNQAQWDAFVSNIKELSIYGTDIDLKPGDEILTLSTCNNYTEDGRLFLVAKRVG